MTFSLRVSGDLMFPLGDTGGLTSSLRGTDDLMFLASPGRIMFPLAGYWLFDGFLLGHCCDTEGAWVPEGFFDLDLLEGSQSPGVFHDSFSMLGALS